MPKQDWLPAILDCGRRYREENLYPYWSPEALLSDWRQGFSFFLGRACYQGRRDIVSDKVYAAAKDALEETIYASDDWLDPNFTHVAAVLGQAVGSEGGKAGKGRDAEMVLSALRFASRLPGHNRVAYSVERVRQGEIRAHYDEMRPERSANGIRQVGPKIAAFYLRDLVSLFDLDALVASRDQALLQPVDVWVRRVADRLGLAAEAAPDADIRAAILDLCEQHGCSPLLFNQGTWYLGYHSFDLLLEQMGAGA